MNIYDDDRIVMTLDAGGTNFVFSALQGGEEITDPIALPSYADDRERSLKTIIEGLHKVQSTLNKSPTAISFAFPGPADYPGGIINNMNNLPAYKGGVPLGPMLEEQFGLPTFINNDGDLFAYGEAMAGILPEINRRLADKNIPKRYDNLFGVTVGTGFGGGMVIDNELALGDNSASAEIWISRNFDDTRFIAEEGVSIRAIQHNYWQNAPDCRENLSPRDIYEIACGDREGDQQAAMGAFEKMGTALGEALANAITLIDGIMVIGGGISGAHDLFLPNVIEQLNSTIETRDGTKLPRLVSHVYNLEDPTSSDAFYDIESKELPIPFSDKTVPFIPEKRLAVGLSRLGTSKATALGAYAFALDQLQAK